MFVKEIHSPWTPETLLIVIGQFNVFDRPNKFSFTLRDNHRHNYYKGSVKVVNLHNLGGVDR